MTSYLILHGWQNHRPEGHWQHWLAGQLTELGHQVTYPQLPDPDDPELDVWLAELERHLDGVEVVVAHSLSVALWLHAVARGLPGLDAVERVLLVAPPSDAVIRSNPEIAGFALPPLEFGLPGPTRLVAGDNDPYCAEGADRLYGDPLGLPADVLSGAGHLDLDAGYGPWPAVLAWCLDLTAGFTPRPA
ncbi:alpha/beta hydrolase [Streptomyces sp. NPDC050803]|uniref:RBBP9/YdeN family alpha/beta hydrolase n=1 Tax=unclassified Streptomyces TaxID=2593676 RepID=UPI00341777F2